MNAQEMLAEINKKFPGLGFDCCRDDFGLAHCVVTPEHYISVATYFRNDPAWKMDLLECLTAVDYLDYITVVSHLYSTTHKHWIVLKAKITHATPKLPTLYNIWPAANWFEREVYDLFGVLFTGHPDLRRIMLPDEWTGHPLLKDYKDENIIKRPAMAREPVVSANTQKQK